GRFIDAEEAFTMGLVNRVVERGTSLERALEMAHGLCRVPQAAMRADKRAAQMGYGQPLAVGLRIEAEAGVPVTQDPNMWEGARAFKEKRSPQFKSDS
ncbi:MAG: enoyl-CoA hydratase-related protein, partial [Myxococcota bacterium]